MNQFEKPQCACIECTGADCTCGCQTESAERASASSCTCGCQEGKPCGCAATE